MRLSRRRRRGRRFAVKTLARTGLVLVDLCAVCGARPFGGAFIDAALLRVGAREALGVAARESEVRWVLLYFFPGWGWVPDEEDLHEAHRRMGRFLYLAAGGSWWESVYEVGRVEAGFVGTKKGRKRA